MAAANAAAPGLARALLERGAAEAGLLRSLAEECRRAGDLALALALLERLDAEGRLDDAAGRDLLSVLSGRRRGGETEPGPPVARPLPFVRLQAFLPSDVRDAVFRRLLDRLEEFQPAEVETAEISGVDERLRRSRVLSRVGDLRRLVLPPVLAAFRASSAADRLGVPELSGGRVHLEASVHGDGAFFGPHTDDSTPAHADRRISFVYYLHRSPRPFEGGALRLYDGSAALGRYATGFFTRVEPDDNSLVLFPSGGVHEVERVRCADADPTSGRFSVNGWFLADDAPD